MKTTNLKIFGTMILLSFSFPIQNVFAGNPVKPEEPGSGTGSNSPLTTTLQIEFVAPVTYDILGDNLAVSFNSPIGTATVTIEDQYGNIIYQSVIDTNTESGLLIPIEDLETGNYTLSVSSESTNFIGAFQL